MSAMSERPEVRADLRDADRHASWREVYHALDAEVAGHE